MGFDFSKYKSEVEIWHQTRIVQLHKTAERLNLNDISVINKKKAQEV